MMTEKSKPPRDSFLSKFKWYDRQTVTSSEVVAEERQMLGPCKVGLAISGGGIRSASFGLGVFQALDRFKRLEQVDYLSTVSGGGYIGSSYTYFMHKGLPRRGPGGTPEWGPKGFPFGEPHTGSRSGHESNHVLDFIRQHGRYLTPTPSMGALSLWGVAIRGMTVSLLIYIALATTAFGVLMLLGLFDPIDAQSPLWFVQRVIPVTNLPLAVAVLLAALVLPFGIFFTLRTGVLSGSLPLYGYLVGSQRRTGFLWTLILGLGVIGAVPEVAGSFESVVTRVATALGLTGVGSVLGLFQFRRGQSAEQADAGVPAKLRVLIGAAALLFGVLLSAYSLAQVIMAQSQSTLLLGATALLAIVIGVQADMNSGGFHRMYRNRLMETFMPDPAAAVHNEWGMAHEANEMPLKDVCREPARPYHLINCNIVLVDSNEAKYRGRGGDSFVFSPLFVGSDATRFASTATYSPGRADSMGMTLPTCMAISGAAVNPNAGVGGKGVTRMRAVSTLLSMLNLRLGYWARNPAGDSQPWVRANYLWPNLFGGVFGRGLRESSEWIELSDGGHFENLGLYELIRRRLDVIIVSDAGADPKLKFDDLGNAIERVRVDFGVQIAFSEDDATDLEGLAPGSATVGGLLPKDELARRGYAVGTIAYPTVSGDAQRTGTLILLKTTLPEGLPVDLYQYKRNHPTFPDQTTADQFFDEVQFEAYRELGYRICKSMLKANQQAGWWQ